jgi:hypothetical protein
MYILEIGAPGNPLIFYSTISHVYMYRDSREVAHPLRTEATASPSTRACSTGNPRTSSATRALAARQSSLGARADVAALLLGERGEDMQDPALPGERRRWRFLPT